MSSQKLQEYIDSLNDLKNASTEVENYGKIIAIVGRYLNTSPYKMTVSNVEFPATAESEYSLNQASWPSAQKLGETLADYVRKRDRVSSLYYSLTDAQRETLKRPPDI